MKNQRIEFIIDGIASVLKEIVKELLEEPEPGKEEENDETGDIEEHSAPTVDD